MGLFSLTVASVCQEKCVNDSHPGIQVVFFLKQN